MGTRRKARRETKQRDPAPREWIGGRLTAPFYITEPQPYRPELILWLELPDGLIVASQFVDPHGPPSPYFPRC